ncbi:hypothetical protein DD238_000679 [Peronospora effusa]|uniref:Uncharacterized protein n=1 Tax=Peronospora effusa TaxID=542832 RepID=A0A3M6VV03_9STRA|nr:hypothetical protein DD238_000679 [Peronospora effusa]
MRSDNERLPSIGSILLTTLVSEWFILESPAPNLSNHVYWPSKQYEVLHQSQSMHKDQKIGNSSAKDDESSKMLASGNADSKWFEFFWLQFPRKICSRLIVQVIAL